MYIQIVFNFPIYKRRKKPYESHVLLYSMTFALEGLVIINAWDRGGRHCDGACNLVWSKCWVMKPAYNNS